MSRVSKRLGVAVLSFVLSAQGAFAAPDDHQRTLPSRIKHFVVIILDQLTVPWP
jgi:hypothetical protein